MTPWQLFLAHVLVFAMAPVALTARRGPLTAPLLYAYIAVISFLTGALGDIYALPLTGSITISGGNLAFGALMFTALVLLFTVRDLEVVRDIVRLVVMVAVFQVALLALATSSLRADDTTNPFGADVGGFAAAFDITIISSVLAVVELMIMAAVLEQVKAFRTRPLRSAWYPAAFIGVLVLDGALFPLLDAPTAPDLGGDIVDSVLGRVVLAGAYAIPVIVYLVLFRDRVERFDAEPLPLGHLFHPPNVSLVREIERQQRAIEYQATHDGLTGLANRYELRRRVDRALSERTAHPDRWVAVMFIDLDDFKTVNDGHGHAAGDALLLQVAERIRSCLREGDLAARLGGDEFTVLLSEISDTATAIEVAHRILERIRGPVVLEDGVTVAVHASIGVAFAEGIHDTDANLLVRNADLAMYHAKDLGKDRVVVFSEDLHERARAHAALMGEIAEGIASRQFVPHYQPLVELSSGRVVGVEALVRWDHPRRGLLSPIDFIAPAERSRSIVHLGAQVLAQACTDAVSWSEGPVPVTVSVNVSPRQLSDPVLVRQVAQALEQSGLPPHRLVLEITESSLMSDVSGSIRTVGQLKALGVRISIDDFGTGFSSLAYLHRFPADQLKIDKSFVEHLCDEGTANGSPLIQSIIGMGQVLDLTVVAEGVENREQREALVDLGCKLGQGFHFAPALPANRITTLLEEPPPGHRSWS